MRLKYIFSKEVDKQVDATLKEVTTAAKGSAKSSKKLEQLLKKDGITLQIYIATGGDKR